MFILRWTLKEVQQKHSIPDKEGELYLHYTNILLHAKKKAVSQGELKFLLASSNGNLDQTLWAHSQQGFLMLSIVATYLQRFQRHKPPWLSHPRNP